MRRLVIGDIHGAYKAMLQVFDRAKFDYDKDRLFVIGDVVDGWPETKQCIDELLKVKNLVFIIGNHDIWAWDWMEDGQMPKIWLTQGGKETIQSYGLSWYGERIKPEVPLEHIQFFKKGVPYFVTEDNKLFVHGGFDYTNPIEKQGWKALTCDRTLFEKAQEQHQKLGAGTKLTPYNEVFIGHTETTTYSTSPVKFCEVWNVDQGAGFKGKLTLMDIDTKEFWSSNQVKTLYKEVI